jgi:hypothetical protein
MFLKWNCVHCISAVMLLFLLSLIALLKIYFSNLFLLKKKISDLIIH